MDVRMCEDCGHQSAVLETRLFDSFLHRRRKCSRCGNNWWTVEVPAKSPRNGEEEGGGRSD